MFEFSWREKSEERELYILVVGIARLYESFILGRIPR